MDGTSVTRHEKCRVCNESHGTEIAIVDFWDIKTSRIVRCNRCNHMQLDPMLTEEETATGCLAYAIEESLRIDFNEQKRNHLRNFRRGVVFGTRLRKKKIFPHSILEMGPGSGYFAAGLQFVFPDSDISVLDISENLLTLNALHHGFKAAQGVPDKFISGFEGMFDLIIARDLLEHVSDISNVLLNTERYLKPGGYLHFITPNGYEDVWKHYLTSQQSHSELLINHVNYFDGTCLKQLLMKFHLHPVEYYTAGFKTTMRGSGWKKSMRLASPAGGNKHASDYIRRQNSIAAQQEFSKQEILNAWYIRKKYRWITYLVSAFHHSGGVKISPENNVGHEIYGLFRKQGEVITA
jgi:SAM-dependent methyltransferase